MALLVVPLAALFRRAAKPVRTDEARAGDHGQGRTHVPGGSSARSSASSPRHRLGFALGSRGSGLIFGVSGSYRLAFLFSIASYLIGTVAFPALRRPPRLHESLAPIT